MGIDPVWNQSPTELLSWLKTNAPSLAEVYEGAVNLLYGNPAVPGRAHFIALAVREIRNELYWQLTGETRPPLLLYKSEVAELATVWKKNGLPTGLSLTDGSLPEREDGELRIPDEVFRKIADLIDRHERVGLKPDRIAENTFVLLASENNEFIRNISPTIKRWGDVTDYFVHLTHVGSKTDRELLTQEFIRNFEEFETILSSLIKGFYGTTDELDKILAEANTRAS